MTIEPISDERLAEIRAGLVGCTPGPWMLEIETSEHVDESEEDRQPEVYVCSSDTCCDCTVVATMGRDEAISHDRKSRDASHIARLDPQTVAALLSRLDKAEESVAIMTALTRTPLYSHRALTERLSQIMGARFGARFMDPPDGGDVPIHEQVERMADALLAAERPSES